MKQRAILGACERGEIEYTRSDGKSFDDPVIDLHGRGILLINKHSFNEWKKTIEKVKTKEVNTNNLNTTYSNFDDFLKSFDEEYISIKDLVNAIHKHIGLNQPIEKAYQVLTSAIGRSEEKPHIF
ncbi:hypothetical protein [Acinetobacter nectaris]|uniref:hypothetical protein n=1 Tax=Acinetobacter nectaris TaxID=1219382 RepID=UPI001F48F8CB|nr:hypothetical protein [Acinetobacter nectaris]MCF9046329.1 hypothetical protein [Acinetobacter nectaris]